jgi:dihydrofolate reductase
VSDLPITLVVAAADNDVIGRGNALPWYLPADLKHFKERTMGRPILMGRRTFESIGRPLPGRSNIVLTRDREFSAQGVRAVRSLDEARELAEDIALIDGSEELMVIGGAQVYALALPLASGISLTRVHLSPEGDTHLPAIDWSQWREHKRIERPADETQPACTFLDYTRVTA